MKRRRLASDGHPGPPQQYSSPWRWNIGGPILDFGDEDVDAGPSSLPCSCDDCVAPSSSIYANSSSLPTSRRRSSRSRRVLPTGREDVEVKSSSPEPIVASVTPNPRQRSRRRRNNPQRSRSLLHPLTTALAISLATAPLATAGPVPLPHRTEALTTATDPASLPTRTFTSIPTDTPTHLSTQTDDPLERRRIASIDLFESPSLVPSATLATLSAEALPYVYTQSSDGAWYPDPRPWWMYGVVMEHRHWHRQIQSAVAGEMNAVAAPTTTTPHVKGKYSVTSTLPKGWGKTRPERSDFYRTPLIVTASVILAILIVTGLIIFALQRRVHNRQKRRHQARMRRKALAAAGLTEQDLDGGSSGAQEAFVKKLQELETAYDIKQRGKTKTRRSKALIRTKVKVWRGGMRRRKPSPGDELKPATSPTGLSTAVVLTTNGSVVSLATTATERTTSTRSTSSSRSSTHHSRLSIHHTGSPTPNTSDQGASGPSEGVISEGAPCSPSMSSNHEGSRGTSDPASSSVEAVPGAMLPSNMPPAYRPASIRSVDAGPSSRGIGSSRDLRPPQVYGPLAPEKASAGFYPAPTTPDAEEAQAVAHRADAKAPVLPLPDDDEEQARMHVATDDKSALERLRLGASAPPVNRVEDEGEAGPSAPVIEVDEAGFERLDDVGEAAEATPQGSTHLTPHDMPAPPSRVLLRSMRTFSDGPSRSASSPLLALPSTPPVERDAYLAPSAPPLGPGTDDERSIVPSAPPLGNNDEDDDWQHGERGSHEVATAPPPSDDGDSCIEDDDQDAPRRDPTQATLTVNGHRFLPVYEP